ncbi:DUF2141 domain-containing protein [Pseudoduganella aquatica]|uniref:DUF2141 domain-containing protein n=1 Tax=Pseudoduganella aquatica TaxID=2660641 RepID=A0A7X4HHM4_9BURK|nr:DUF2141 domain-containing protein [Pseudoduganella aquatica]MYN11325.1 DUF2141 domain-containing protein [Pseudoduganella aquatica]
MHLTLTGWLHTLACSYALIIGGAMLWRAKGGAVHRRDGMRYIYAMLLANLTALGVYQLGGFNVFHILALCTLLSLAVAFASARWRKPGRYWLRIHLSAMLFSYYQLVGGLINEAFVRIPALHGQKAMAGLAQGVAMMVFLMVLSYFWGKTARSSAAAIALAALASSAQAGTLTLDLKGVQAGQGNLVIALYNSSEDFLKKPLRKLTVPAANAAMRVDLTDVPAGDYAVSLFQDINSDGKLDTRMFGIPTEPTGTSNNAKGSFGPPKYEAARFTVSADGKAIPIELHK